MNATGLDADAFKAEQRRNWNGLSSDWDKWYDLFESGAAAATGALLAAAEVTFGDSILDIGSGTGQPALAAATLVGPNGHVLGIDQAADMLAIARRRSKDLGLDNTEFSEMDAEFLELPPGSVDAAISRWSLMFLPDAPRALRSVHTALRPGGILAAVVWGSAPQVPMLSLGFSVVAARLGMGVPPAGLPGPFSMADPQHVTRMLAEAGFTDVSAKRCPIVFTPASAEEFADFSMDLLPGWLKAKLDAVDAGGARTRLAVAAAATEFASDLGPLQVPCLSYSLRAVKPR